MESSEVQAQKDIQFYGQAVNAWLNLSFEYDKGLITLSTAGIGLAVTLLTTVENISLTSLAFYALSIVYFAITIGLVLVGFLRSKKHIESILVEGRNESDPGLKVLDRSAAISFAAAVLTLAGAGIAAGVSSYLATDKDMTKKEKGVAHVVFANDSINNLASLRPSLESINRLGALKPAVQAVVPPAATARPVNSVPPPLPPLPPHKK